VSLFFALLPQIFSFMSWWLPMVFAPVASTERLQRPGKRAEKKGAVA